MTFNFSFVTLEGSRFVIIANPIDATYRWLSCRHACLPRAASMANSCACSSSSPTSRPTTVSRPLDISRTRTSSVTVAESSSSNTSAPLGWHCSGCCATCRSHYRTLPRRCTSRPAAPQHGLRRATTSTTAMSATSPASPRHFLNDLALDKLLREGFVY